MRHGHHRIAAAIVVAIPLCGSAEAAAIEIAFTSETGFNPLPCECPENPLGGWAERSALFDSLVTGDGDPLILDCGGWLDGDAETAIALPAMRAIEAMGYDAVNVGAPDLEAACAILSRSGAPNIPFVCGHPDRPAGLPAFRIFESADGRVGVIGAASFGPGFPSPAEQVSAALKTMPPAETIVVLCSGGLGPARTIATSQSEVDIVLFGEGARTPSPVDLDGALGMAAGTKGRYVGHLSFDPDPVFDLIPVRAGLGEDAALKTLAIQAAAREAGGSTEFARMRFTYRE